MIAKGGVLKADEAGERIRSRRLEEIEQAREKVLLWDKRGKARKAFKRKLDFMAELDNPHRLAPRAKRAVSM